MAYVVNIPPSTMKLSYLPMTIRLPKSDEEVVLRDYVEEDFESIYALMKGVVEDGQSYPQDTLDRDQFRSYYLPNRTFVMRTVADGDLVGCFYIKPNFPGRSSHLCNAGFAVNPVHRGKGALHVLTKMYLRIAHDFGYLGSFFNLVYMSNKSAYHVYKKLGFSQVGLIPKAGNMKGIGLVDSAQFYYDLTTLDSEGNPPGGWVKQPHTVSQK